MTGSPPDLSSLSLNSHSSQQRLHDSYDYEGNVGNRNQYHFATSPGLPIQSQYNPLTTGQSPLKKPVRSGLPTVSSVHTRRRTWILMDSTAMARQFV